MGWVEGAGAADALLTGRLRVGNAENGTICCGYKGPLTWMMN